MTVSTIVATTQVSSAYTRNGTARINAHTLTCPFSMDWCFSDGDPYNGSFQNGKSYQIHTSQGNFWAVLETNSSPADLDDSENPDYGGVIEFTIIDAEEIETPN